MSKSSHSLRNLTVSAVLLAIALVLKTFFSFYIPLFGQNGMSVGISGVFSMMPSFLFGPFYGAAVSGLNDLLGYLLKPSGAYMPLLTLTAALGGFIRGGLFFAMKKCDERIFRIIALILSILLLVAGIAGFWGLKADGVDSGYYDRIDPQQADPTGMHLVSRMVIERTRGMKNPSGSIDTYLTYLTWGPTACGALGLLLLLIDLLAGHFMDRKNKKVYMPSMLMAMLLSGMVVTTLNTLILQETVYASWKLLPFAIVWTPRAIEEIVVGTVKICIIAFLMKAMDQIPGLRER